MQRQILDEIPPEVLQADLERYRLRALELGATDAKIISADEILIDERVRMKCHYPKCGNYGTNVNCPPHAPDLDQVRKTVSRYKYAIFIKLEVPSEEVAGPDAVKKGLVARAQKTNYEIVSAIESEAFYDGYYLALGFAGGPCKRVFCPDKECRALTPGQGCRHAMKARSAMEGVGMDAFGMAARVGWKIYPVGARTLPEELPHGTRLGLVLIY